MSDIQEERVGISGHTGPRACCCYTIDEGYLLPTMLSATQLRAGLSPTRSDVIIVCFGPASALTTAAEAICHRQGIRFILVPKAVLGGAPMLCARFFLPAILETRYHDVVYLDGDTQVAGSLEPLLARRVALGDILAAPDCMAVMIDNDEQPWPARRAYFDMLGLPSRRQASYFNSGVLRFNRSDWDALSQDCLKLCARRGSAFAFHDQDALNIAVGDRHRPISFRWNFPPFFLNFGAEVSIAPHVYHFMSNPRPWQGAFAPWGAAWHEPYVAFLAENPIFARSVRRLGRLQAARYVAQQRFKRQAEARRWGTPAVRQRIAEMEAAAVV